jgi:hypothetical protein
MSAERERRGEQETGLNGHAPLFPKVVRGVKTADDRLVTLVRERPLLAVGAALVLGYLIGRVVTRLD